MNGFYISPWVISELVFFILALSMTVYLLRVKNKTFSTSWLTGYAAAITLTVLVFILMYLSPLNSLNYGFYLCSYIPGQISILLMLQFAYHFPVLAPHQRSEARLALWVTTGLALLITGETVYLLLFPAVYYELQPENIWDTLTMLQYLWIMGVLLRRTVELSEAQTRQGWVRALWRPQGKASRAVRAYALATSVLFWINLLLFIGDNQNFDLVTLIGQLVLFLAFMLVYLTYTPEQTTILVKMVGITLVTTLEILSVVGVIFWSFLLEVHAAQTTFQDPQALRFQPDAAGSYDITFIPVHFDAELGAPLAVPEDGSVPVALDFPFPLYGREWTTLYVADNGVITFGAPFNAVLLSRGAQPAIVPLLADFIVAEDNPIWFKAQAETATITWNSIAEYQNPTRRNTLQVVLRADGSFDMIYYGVASVHTYYAANTLWDARLRGVFSGEPRQPITEISLADGQPYHGTAPGGIVEPYYAQYRRYMHTRMRPLVGLIGIASGIILVAFPLLFRTILIKPLDALVAATQQINTGDLSVTVTPHFNDEIGFLAHSFNAMVVGLRDREWLRDIFGRFVSHEVAEALRNGQVKLEGEYRVVSVLFCDIRGFTDRSERCTPAEIFALLNAYLPVVVEAAQRHQGTVNKFGGDSALIIYGAPRHVEESAYQAVLTALELRTNLAQLNQQLAARGEAPIRIGVGINTGVALAGAIGPRERQEYTVIGDAVNLASRIEALNKVYPEHGILISEATYEALGAHRAEFAFVDIGEVNIRGKADPVHIWAVAGELRE